MITFRARSEHATDWTHVTLDGPDEEVLGHEVARLLAGAGWETLVAQSGGDFEDLDEGWL